MDWSSVFEDGGEEEGDWTRDEITSSRTGMLEILKSEGNYGPLTCYAFTVNYILGVGCLGIPYAFLQCGVLLGTVSVITLSYVSYVTVMWVAEASQQEMQMSLYLSNSNPFILSPVLSVSKKKQHVQQVGNQPSQRPLGSNFSSTASLPVDEKSPINNSLKANLYSSLTSIGVLRSTNPSSNSLPPLAEQLDPLLLEAQAAKGVVLGSGSSSETQLASKGREFIDRKRRELSEIAKQKKNGSLIHDGSIEMEVTDLVSEYIGPYGKFCYQCSLMMLTYVGLLAYTQVFNSSFASQVWPAAPQYVAPLLFGIIVVPLSCFDLAEQVTVQVVMSLLRFLSLG
jgi:hypothetical protein